MKFNVELPEDTKEYLTRQYKGYIKNTPMTKNEMRALREWVKNGNSVYDNPSGAWSDGMVRLEFLDDYRDTEHIRLHTKGMTTEERRRFGMAYYGWKNESDVETPIDAFYEGDVSNPFG